jgi:hypothetical protein
MFSKSSDVCCLIRGYFYMDHFAVKITELKVELIYGSTYLM